jgi:hypothetical protein
MSPRVGSEVYEHKSAQLRDCLFSSLQFPDPFPDRFPANFASHKTQKLEAARFDRPLEARYVGIEGKNP